MDVSKLKVAMSAPMHVRDAAGTLLFDDGKPVRIIFHSPASRPFAELETRQLARSVTTGDSQQMVRDWLEDLPLLAAANAAAAIKDETSRARALTAWPKRRFRTTPAVIRHSAANDRRCGCFGRCR